MRLGSTVLITLVVSSSLGSTELPQLPYSHRVLSNYLLNDGEATRTPSEPSETTGTVLIVFWTSERGTVVSARGLDGPPELQKEAVDVIYKWKFKPKSFNGQPVQMGSSVMVDFSRDRAAIVRPTKTITAAQLSPGFQYKCFDGLIHDNPASVGACQIQLEDVLQDSHSTLSDRFTARNQYGLVLMKYPHDARNALEQFSKAIEIATERLDSTNAECAYTLWYRGTAEQQLGNSVQADKDFSLAENGLREAEKAIGDDKIAAYYHELLNRVVTQHTASQLDPQPNANAAFPEIHDWKTLRITLSRSGCYGGCPAYKIEIHGDGTVLYDGEANVAHKGRNTAKISHASTVELVEFFRKANYFSLRDRYASGITDSPAYETSIAFDGVSKSVLDYMGRSVGMPSTVTDVENAIDRLSEASKWVGHKGAK